MKHQLRDFESGHACITVLLKHHGGKKCLMSKEGVALSCEAKLPELVLCHNSIFAPPVLRE